MSGVKKQPVFDRKYLKRVALWVAVSLLSLGTVIYFGYHIISAFRRNADMTFARRTTLENTVTCDGYVMRTETPIGSGGAEAGSLSSALEDGEKVKASEKVADLYSVSSPDVQSKLASIDRQIAMLESSRTVSVVTGDTGSLDDSIFTTVTEMRRASEAGNLGREASLYSDLFLKMKKRGVITGEITDFDVKIAELTARKEELRASLGTLLGTVTAPASGYYYSRCDGYEEIFSADKIDTLTVASFRDLIKSEPSPPAGADAGKIVTSFKWYLCCPMSAEDAGRVKARYERSPSVPLRVTMQNNADVPLDMIVYNIITSGDDGLVILECGEVREGFDFTRLQSVRIVTDEVTGFSVPVSSVRMKDGKMGVFVLDQVTVEFRRIEVIGENGGNYLCRDVSSEEVDDPSEWLGQNDLIIIGGTGIREGMTYHPPKS